MLINEDGEAVSPARTDIKPDVVYVRADGWMLGASLKLADIAESLWRDEWVAVIDLKPGTPVLTAYDRKEAASG